MPGAGGWRAALGRPGNWPPWRGEAKARPPPSHTWRGPCCILPDIKGFCRGDTLANLAMPSGRDLLAAVGPSLCSPGCECPRSAKSVQTSQRVDPAGPAPVQRARGDVEEHLAGEGVVPGCSGASSVMTYSMVSALGAGSSRCTRRARLVIPSADWSCMAALTCGPSSGKSRSRWNRVRPPSTVVSW